MILLKQFIIKFVVVLKIIKNLEKIHILFHHINIYGQNTIYNGEN